MSKQIVKKRQNIYKNDIINLDIYEVSNYLTPFIQAIWFIENKNNKDEVTYKILSDGRSGLVFNFGDSILIESNHNKICSKKDITITGPTKYLTKMTVTGSIKAVGIRFHHESGHLFFRSPMHTIANRILNDRDNLLPESKVLYKKISNVHNREKIKSILEGHLEKIINHSDLCHFFQLSTIMKEIFNNEHTNLNELKAKLEISSRDMQRLFRNYMGIPLVTFLKLFKIHKVKEKIINNDYSSLTELSYNIGYFDQAHFIRSFKYFMEITPNRYIGQKQKMNKKV